MTDFSGSARAPAGCKVAGIALRGSNFVHTTAVAHQNLALSEVADFHETVLNFVEAGQAPIIFIDSSCAGLRITDQVAAVAGYLITVP
jgi:hypothetical protein